MGRGTRGVCTWDELWLRLKLFGMEAAARNADGTGDMDDRVRMSVRT